MFTITPRMASAAISQLAQFVQERELAVEQRKIGTTVEAARLMDQLYQLKEELQTRAKSPVEKLYDKLRFTTLPNFMDGEEITNIGVEGIGRVNLQDDVSIKVNNKASLHEWLTHQGLEDMITESVNAQTLAAFVRRRLQEAGQNKKLPDLPNDTVFTIKPIVRAVITRG